MFIVNQDYVTKKYGFIGMNMVTFDIKDAVCGLQVTTCCAERNSTKYSGINLM